MTRFPPIGAMRHRVRLDRVFETPDLAGGVARAWLPVSTLWAAIEPVERRADLHGDAPSTIATHRVTIRWRSDVEAGQRIAYGVRRFEILTAADPDERRYRLHLTVEEIAV
jgi:SPP1 family predicted phage head-tail adaptor